MQKAMAFVVILTLVSAPMMASAQIPTIVPCEGLNCNICDLAQLAQNILNAAMYLAVFLSALLFAYAGWLYLSNEAIGQQQKAKSLFTDVLLGLVIILAAWLVVDTLMQTLVGSEYLPWNSLCS